MAMVMVMGVEVRMGGEVCVGGGGVWLCHSSDGLVPSSTKIPGVPIRPVPHIADSERIGAILPKFGKTETAVFDLTCTGDVPLYYIWWRVETL